MVFQVKEIIYSIIKLGLEAMVMPSGYLHFVDDNILFCDASREQLLSIRLTLTCFQAFTILKVNVGKSEIVPIGEVSNIQTLANILQCRVGNLPMIYLGMPLGTSYKTTSIRNPILERMKKLLGQKHFYLSKGGRLTLLKSTLSSLSTYYLSLFTVPKAVTIRLERIQRNFLWRTSEECFKYPLVAWEKVYLPCELGSLGIWKLVSFNHALLGKQLWRYVHETIHLWWKVIAMKYGEGKGGWSTRVCRRAHGCSLWQSISEGRESFSKHLSLMVRDGSRILFWHNKWIGDNSLKTLYPQLFMCSAIKEACISDVLSPSVSGNDIVELKILQGIQ